MGASSRPPTSFSVRYVAFFGQCPPLSFCFWLSLVLAYVLTLQEGGGKGLLELYETITNLSLFLKGLSFSVADTIGLYRVVIDFSKLLSVLFLYVLLTRRKCDELFPFLKGPLGDVPLVMYVFDAIQSQLSTMTSLTFSKDPKSTINVEDLFTCQGRRRLIVAFERMLLSPFRH